MTVVSQRNVDAAESAQRRARFPLGAALTMADLSDAGREHVLDEVREREPVTWVPALDGWLVTSRDGVRELLAAPTATVQAQQNLVRASLGRMMLTVDGAEHRRLRQPFERHFKTGALQSTWSAVIAAEADRLLDDLAPAGAAEIGESFAAPFAVRLAGDVLGLTLTEPAIIAAFYAAFAGAMVYDGDPEPQRHADAAREALDALLHAELARCRSGAPQTGPAVSLTARLAADGQGLTDDEVVAQLRVIMFGAIETVQASVMNTLLLLLRHPDAMAAVRADPALLADAVEEAHRLIPPVAFVERWTSAATTFGGVDIPANEFVGGSILAANRDPATFAQPLRFDLHRPNAGRALTFSYGVHACLGLHLARLQTTIAVQRVLDRLPDLQPGRVQEPAGFAFRRPGVLNLRWTT